MYINVVCSTNMNHESNVNYHIKFKKYKNESNWVKEGVSCEAAAGVTIYS